MGRSRFDTFLYWLKGSIICCAILMLVCAVCGPQMARKAPGKTTLIRLEVYSAVENPLHIYHARYPFDYFVSVHDAPRSAKAENGKTTLLKLENAKRNDPKSDNAITPEEELYFIDYVSALPEEYVRGETLACLIRCDYRDADGNEHYLSRHVYDEFPEDWDVFIDRYNEILGDDYLARSGKLVAVTPEFLTEIFGVTDEDVKEGTLQDVIDSQQLDITRVATLFYMKDALDYYYASVKEDLLAPYRPTELISVDSTEEEYNAFLEEYLQKLGVSMATEIIPSGRGDYVRRFKINEEFDVYTARTADMENLPVVQSRDGEYYYLLMDVTFGRKFIYNADFKYILAPDSSYAYPYNPDIMLPFIE